MFDFIPEPTFQALVPLSVPGKPEPWDVTFTFRHKGKKALAEWIATWLTTTTDSEGNVTVVERPDVEILAEVIEGWGVARAGESVPYTRTALSELLDRYPASAREIRASYLRELTESKRKNS